MSKYKGTVTFEIDSDDLSLEAITEYFDNMAGGDNGEVVEVEDEDCADGLGEMTITSADARFELTEY